MVVSQNHHLRTESHIVRIMQFVGEQDGEPEREFKEQVVPLLCRNAEIERGYLARVVYESSSSVSVVLCLVAQQPCDALVWEVGAVFATMFGRDQHLDVLFVGRDHEQGLAQVCSPFFEANT
jgi:hypothetical protein